MSFTPSAATTRLLTDKFSGTGNPLVNWSAVWNNAATTFTGIQFDVTDTASAAGSLLMNLRVGGASRLSVEKDGTLYNNGFSIGTAAGYRLNTNGVKAATGTALYADTAGIQISGTNGINFTVGQVGNSAGDLVITRDAADTLAQRRGENPQAFRIYNTFTDVLNYERGALQWQSNELQLRVDGVGTGQNRPLQILVAGQIVAYFSSLGNRSVALGAGAVATNATSGFVYVPTCAGAPTGVPESYTGRAPIVVDTTNNKLYFYSGGVWRDAGP